MGAVPEEAKPYIARLRFKPWSRPWKAVSGAIMIVTREPPHTMEDAARIMAARWNHNEQWLLDELKAVMQIEIVPHEDVPDFDEIANPEHLPKAEVAAKMAELAKSLGDTQSTNNKPQQCDPVPVAIEFIPGEYLQDLLGVESAVEARDEMWSRLLGLEKTRDNLQLIMEVLRNTTAKPGASLGETDLGQALCKARAEAEGLLQDCTAMEAQNHELLQEVEKLQAASKTSNEENAALRVEVDKLQKELDGDFDPFES